LVQGRVDRNHQTFTCWHAPEGLFSNINPGTEIEAGIRPVGLIPIGLSTELGRWPVFGYNDDGELGALLKNGGYLVVRQVLEDLSDEADVTIRHSRDRCILRDETHAASAVLSCVASDQLGYDIDADI